MNSTFTASDGQDYEMDVWHPLPFWITSRGCKSGSCRAFRFPGVPTLGAGNLLVRKFRDGTIEYWGPITTLHRMAEEKKNPATHWMVKSWSDYMI